MISFCSLLQFSFISLNTKVQALCLHQSVDSGQGL